MKHEIGLKARAEPASGFRHYLIDQRCLALPTTSARVSMTL